MPYFCRYFFEIMAYHHYQVDNNTITNYWGEIPAVLSGFVYYEHKSFGESEIHYHVTGSKVTSVIVETNLVETYARVEAEEFLENL